MYLSKKQAKQDNFALFSAMGGKLMLMNIWIGFYEEAKLNGLQDPAIIAWVRFKEKYRKEGLEWVRKEV